MRSADTLKLRLTKATILLDFAVSSLAVPKGHAKVQCVTDFSLFYFFFSEGGGVVLLQQCDRSNVDASNYNTSS